MHDFLFIFLASMILLGLIIFAWFCVNGIQDAYSYPGVKWHAVLLVFLFVSGCLTADIYILKAVL